MGNRLDVYVIGMSTFNLDLGSRPNLLLLELLHAPKVVKNIPSIHKLVANNMEVSFKDNNIYVMKRM